ncbi:MAG: enoyl-CoA hydratase/isomerase family protein [Acidimicrobiia bacterium]|nr:enoyl-CoA hydratase/isomerase family protein [Acidimicrobiia bacterium]
MSDALDGLAGDESVSAVVLTGRGDTFTAGFDLDEFDRLDDEVFAAELWASSDRFHRVCLSFPLPLLAAVNGPALAGGFDLAVMCDLRVVSSTAWFSHPELRFSEVVYGPLHELVGGAAARDLALTGRRGRRGRGDTTGSRHAGRRTRCRRRRSRGAGGRIAASPWSVLARMKRKIVARAGVVGERTLDL